MKVDETKKGLERKQQKKEQNKEIREKVQLLGLTERTVPYEKPGHS